MVKIFERNGIMKKKINYYLLIFVNITNILDLTIGKHFLASAYFFNVIRDFDLFLRFKLSFNIQTIFVGLGLQLKKTVL